MILYREEELAERQESIGTFVPLKGASRNADVKEDELGVNIR
jgi:hypothetical protein